MITFDKKVNDKVMIIYCDGGSRGNPGPAASAFVVTQDDVVVYKEGKYLGLETNNFAEYSAVLMAVTWLSKNLAISHKQSLPHCGQQLIINLDSQLVERQLNGFYKIKNEKLKEIFDKIKLEIGNCGLEIAFKWGYREKNTLADQLVNKTLDLALQRENEK